MKLHERLKQFMDEKGIKQSHVAVMSGFNPKTFNAIFCDRRKMTADEFEIICTKGLQVDPRIFFGNRFLESKKETPTPAA